MPKKLTNAERIEAVADYAGEVADSIRELIDAMSDNMPPRTQQIMREIKGRLSQAGRDLSDALGE